MYIHIFIHAVQLSITFVVHVVQVPAYRYTHRSTIDQFSNLDVIAGRILGCYEHGPTFFVREILDGIGTQPGGDYIHSVCRHRQVVPQSPLKYHITP